jgi:hypothetical protein
MSNPNFDAILTTTINNYRNKLTDNVFSARPFQYWLLSKGKLRQINGGVKIVEQLIYGMNSTAASYSGYDTIGLTAQTGLTAAEFPWKQYAASIAINGLEEAQNNGEEELIDLLEAKIMQTEETLKEKFDQMFLQSDGTGNSGKDWLGLVALVGDHNDSVTTVGGINCTTAGNEYWRSYREATAGSLTLAQLSTAFNATSLGNDQPDLALTTQTLYERYEGLLQPNQRFTDPKTAQAGFQNLLYKGSVVMWDTYVTSGVWYFLNSKYLKLVTHKQNWMKHTPFVRPENMDARYALILCYGNLTVSNRKRQGKLINKTA